MINLEFQVTMKKAQRIKKELLIVFSCILFAIGLTVISIVKNKSSWDEILEQLHIVLFVAVLIYILILMFRIFAWGINRLLNK